MLHYSPPAPQPTPNSWDDYSAKQRLDGMFGADVVRGVTVSLHDLQHSLVNVTVLSEMHPGARLHRGQNGALLVIDTQQPATDRERLEIDAGFLKPEDATKIVRIYSLDGEMLKQVWASGSPDERSGTVDALKGNFRFWTAGPGPDVLAADGAGTGRTILHFDVRDHQLARRTLGKFPIALTGDWSGYELAEASIFMPARRTIASIETSGNFYLEVQRINSKNKVFAAKLPASARGARLLDARHYGEHRLGLVYVDEEKVFKIIAHKDSYPKSNEFEVVGILPSRHRSEAKFSASGRLLLSPTFDGIRGTLGINEFDGVFYPASKCPPITLPAGESVVRFDVSPNEKFVAVYSRMERAHFANPIGTRHIRVYSLDAMRASKPGVVLDLPIGDSEVTSMVFENDSAMIVAASGEGESYPLGSRLLRLELPVESGKN